MRLVRLVARCAPYTRWVALVLGLYLVAIVTGASTSSIGVGLLRQDPAQPLGIQLGAAQQIRSDEFATDSPIVLGAIAAPGGYRTNLLTQSPDVVHQLPDGPTTNVTFFEGVLFRGLDVAPDQMVFAARWWMPLVLLAIFTPLWFKEVTGRYLFGFLCAGLVFFAPSNSWWSNRPTHILGFLFLGCYLAFPLARRLASRRWLAATAIAIVAAVCFARYPTNYQPFALVAGLPVIVATLVALGRSPAFSRRVRVGTIATVAGLSSLLFAGVVIENWSAIEAAADTVYPGQRRSSGLGLPAWAFFSAPVLSPLRDTSQIVASNASEISSAFTVAAIWAIALLLTSRTLRARVDAWVVLPVLGLTVLWMSWIAFDWGTLGARIPIANLVPPLRAMAMVGISAGVLVCLVLSYARPPRTWMVPVAAALPAGVLTAWGGISLQERHFPSLGTGSILISAAVTALCVAMVTRFPDRAWPVAVTLGALFVVAVRVNPLIFGLGDLRESATAEVMLDYGAQARSEGTFWASDFLPLDSLMFATATPSLSGRQQSGPNRAEWAKLDPLAEHTDVWNRGGAYIWFRWAQGGGDVVLANGPTPDTILVTVAPCELHRREPRVRWIGSTVRLTGACLRPEREVVWAGTTNYLYRVGSTPSRSSGDQSGAAAEGPSLG